MKVQAKPKKAKAATPALKSKSTKITDTTPIVAAAAKDFNDDFGADEVPFEEVTETSEGFDANNKVADDRNAEDFSEDEDQEDSKEGQYGYGWGYNDGFDSPDDEDDKEYMDEDELYASGSESGDPDDE